MAYKVKSTKRYIAYDKDKRTMKYHPYVDAKNKKEADKIATEIYGKGAGSKYIGKVNYFVKGD